MSLTKLNNTPPWDWPENASKIILDVLNNNQANRSDRVLAAVLAGNAIVINDEIADKLLFILKNNNEPEELRCRAAISLGPALEDADIMEEEDIEDMMISAETFHKIQNSLHRLYMDAGVPKEVRRRILEASVRAPRNWQEDAVRAAYFSGDDSWRLTAVFCMNYIGGFDDKIIESLENNNPHIFFEAVCAAGNSGITEAWPYITKILDSEKPDKELLLAAIDAVAEIRPDLATEVLGDFIHSDDQDIVDTAYEALAMAESIMEMDDMDFDDEDEDFFDDEDF